MIVGKVSYLLCTCAAHIARTPSTLVILIIFTTGSISVRQWVLRVLIGVGASSGRVSAGRIQRMRVCVRPNWYRQDAHDGGRRVRPGSNPARLPPHLPAHRDFRLVGPHASRLLLVRRALPRRRSRPALERMQEAHY